MDELFHYEAKKTKHLVRVEVTDEKITFLAVNAAAWVFEADIKDIVGCHLMKNVSLNDPYLRIFYYPFDDRRTRRRQIIVDLKPAGDKAYDDCLKIKLMILRASCGFPRDWSGKLTYLKALIDVVPLLSEANIGCDAVFTTGPNHARRLLKTMDLTVYRGIVVISGDGLLFEVINGLLEREDWETAIQVPLGIIPQGSGNGIARTLADAQK
ncbi:hypothetical protein QYM36_012241 [Artemia franciscana]|uniref:DAGKc domain-containing protein n=1 Tax=Artemia franciscana TaxID=6661 RepID=A0AA88HL82_ARTSF|nr:hypothetical protein QYM36_012241 [Artemia franciscana]